jgi:hypothetical protein
VPQLANALHTKVLGSSQDVRIVRHDDWRKFVVDRFGELERSGAQAARMFITSGGHAMAAEFKLKGRPGEPTQYVLKVYDPSVTPAHKRASSDDPSRLQTESLADFLAGPAWFDSYFGHKEKVKEKVFAAISIPATGVASLPELPSGGFGDRRVSGEVPPLDASAMHHVMTLGLGGTLRDMGGELLQLARSSPQEAHDLLIARDAEGRPGLCTAASYDRADTIATYCEVVSASALPPELKASLLESRSVKGTPALYAAAYTASAVTCQALIDGILQSGLESPVRAGLLTGAIQGVPAMNIAAQQGRVEIVQAFVERVSRSDLPVSTQVELLAARGADGVSALAHLARWGHGAIDTLVRSVLASRLPSSAKVELLRAEHDGHPVLQTLLAAAAPDAVAGYRQAVLNAELEPHDRAALLGMSSR